jgi:hypothetical protein
MKTAPLLVLALALTGVVGCHHDAPAGEPVALKGPLADFHKVLAPVWHMDKGPERVAKACEHAHRMQELANASVKEPGVNKGAAEDLSGAVAALSSACSGSRGDVEGKLAGVHQAFHKVAEGH